MMYRRKLHVDGEDPQRLYRALRQLYSEGVRIPFGKPYSVRKNARIIAQQPSAENELSVDCSGLTLERESTDDANGLCPYGNRR